MIDWPKIKGSTEDGLIIKANSTFIGPVHLSKALLLSLSKDEWSQVSPGVEVRKELGKLIVRRDGDIYIWFVTEFSRACDYKSYAEVEFDHSDDGISFIIDSRFLKEFTYQEIKDALSHKTSVIGEWWLFFDNMVEYFVITDFSKSYFVIGSEFVNYVDDTLKSMEKDGFTDGEVHFREIDNIIKDMDR